MTTTLRLRFTVTGWEPDEIAAPGTADWVGAATMRKTYSGALEGSGVAHFVSSGTEEDGRAYTAAERIEGRLDGVESAIVVFHGGLQAPEGSDAFGWIVPGSGTGGFAGATGTAEIDHDDDGTVLLLHVA